MNWKMIPFTDLPPINDMTSLEISVRSALLGVIFAVAVGTLAALVMLAWACL